jgi:hypothetical protein
MDGDNPFGFIILDKVTRERVLHVMHTKYNYDTVRVYKENWDEAAHQQIDFSGLIIFDFIDKQMDQGVVNQLITKRYFMYFNYQDIDTIDISFKMRLDDCSDQRMSYFKVAYNDSVYFDSPTTSVNNSLSFLK